MASRAKANEERNVQGEGLVRKNSKRARASSGSGSRERPPVVWTEKEKKELAMFEQFTFHSTRFAEKEILAKMGLLDDVETFLQSIGLGVLINLDAPTFEVPVKHLLATLRIEYAENTEKRAQDGMLRFKVDNNEYALSIFDVCEAYGFATRSQTQFPMLYNTDLVWKTIAGRSYESRSAKTTSVRNPVLRYVCKLLANTLFARHETGAVLIDEVCFIFQGIKGTLRNRHGELVEDDLGDDVNYGSILATRVMEVKAWAKLAKKKHVWLGGFLTPLLAKAGVDLRRYAPNDTRCYIDRSYLVTNRFLKGGRNKELFIYRVNDATKKTRNFKLPNTARTTLLGLDNVEFILQEHEFSEGITQQPLDESMDELTDDIYDLPDIDFNPTTPREHLIHKAYTMQKALNKTQRALNKMQKAINNAQKKVIAKIFRKLKKIQPPNYVSSTDEEEEDQHHTEDHDEETQSDNDLELRTKSRADRPSTSRHE